MPGAPVFVLLNGVAASTESNEGRVEDMNPDVAEVICECTTRCSRTSLLQPRSATERECLLPVAKSLLNLETHPGFPFLVKTDAFYL
ncbi:MAG: hypothetical protein D6820_10415 [Lentisphaerae bacterium]|nr:MAG: hypothetical protein D6820_10415 [Lentisphaerota bacterium]